MKLLFVGDEQKGRRMVSSGFPPGSCSVRTASSRRAMEGLVAADAFHAACVDLKMTGDDGVAIIEALHRRVPRLPIVALVNGTDARASAGLRLRGVCAELRAPFSGETLLATVMSHALKTPVGAPAGPAEAPPGLRRGPGGNEAEPPALIVRDAAARRAVDMALRAAVSNAAILILGETGTGKSLLAQTIHRHSAIKDKPFVTVSCPCLNRELLESDLFGHVRGAFTGAVQDTWGKVAAADGGTLFLDEVGDLPAALQPKLLRLLQEKHYERVGETISRTANVRIIAATNRDLRAEVAAGRFREDLYYRLNVISLEVPPLRDRRADILPTAERFLEEIGRQIGKRPAGFTAEARRLLEEYPWPGNLRELRNAIERAAILSSAGALDAEDFPSLQAPVRPTSHQIGAPVSLQTIEEAHIQMVVANSPSLEEAARVLKIDKSTLYRRRKAMEARVEVFTAPKPNPTRREAVLATGG